MSVPGEGLAAGVRRQDPSGGGRGEAGVAARSQGWCLGCGLFHPRSAHSVTRPGPARPVQGRGSRPRGRRGGGGGPRQRRHRRRLSRGSAVLRALPPSAETAAYSVSRPRFARVPLCPADTGVTVPPRVPRYCAKGPAQPRWEVGGNPALPG